MLKILLVTTIILFLSGCGDGSNGDDDSAVTSMLGGTAATGAAFDGVVNIYGSNGGSLRNVPINTSGNYSVDVAGLTAPYFINAVPINANLAALYSWAGGPGITNITPFTSLAMFYANGEQPPASLVSAWPGNSINVTAALPNVKAIINANFIGVFSALDPTLNTDFTSYDIFSSELSIGDTFGQILDISEIDVSGSVPEIIINGSVFSFNPDIDISEPGTGGGGSTGLGNLAITGVDTSVIGVSFVPTFELITVGGGTWSGANISVLLFIDTISEQLRGMKLQYGKATLDENQNIVSTVYSYEIMCSISFSQPDCSKISLEINDKNITLDDVEFGIDILGGGVINNATDTIRLDGTLFWD